ncbi:hypothetical protein [Rhizorhabdus wittichii]|nr:hypothetical protein [Rhizorhabdus wittichii]
MAELRPVPISLCAPVDRYAAWLRWAASELVSRARRYSEISFG